MNSKLSFLECLLSDELRLAFLRGRVVFVLSESLDDIIFANGAAASFLRFATISEAIGSRSGFSIDIKRKIKLALESGSVTQLHGARVQNQAIATNFVFRPIVLANNSKGVLAESLDDEPYPTDFANLISGLADDISEAGIVSFEGEILAQSRNFRRLLLASGHRPNALAHYRLEKWQSYYQNSSYWFGSIRLSDKPLIYLMIASREPDRHDICLPDQQHTSTTLTIADLDHANSDSGFVFSDGRASGDAAPRKLKEDEQLNDEEKLAFREIAQRLRDDLVASGNREAQQSLVSEPESYSEEDEFKHFASFAPASVAQPAGDAGTMAEDLKNVLDLVSDGIVLLNCDGFIIKMSHAALALCGRQADELYGLQFADLFDLASQAVIRDYLYELSHDPNKALLNSGRDVTLQVIGGGHLPVFLTIMTLNSGRGFGVIMRDVSVRDNATELFLEQVIHNNQGGLTPHLAHEIRTPLNAMIGFAELMRDERFGPIGSERYRGYIRDIVHSGYHIMGLLNDTLVRSKEQFNEEALVDSDQKNGHSALQLALYDCLSLFKEQANSNGIILRISVSTNIHRVSLSERVIKQIIINLLSNSIRFTPSGGQIIISATNITPGLVQLRIKDTGFGMTTNELQRALQPYEQIARQDNRQGDLAFQGTGLGLPLVRSLVEANGGSIDIRSKPAVGTTVTLALPAL